MKKIISLLLAAVLLFGSVATLSSCGKKDAEIVVYLDGHLYDFDPALAFVNDDAVQILSLLYEPLFTLSENGKVKKALAKSYKIIEDEEEGIYQMEIVLRPSKWSDKSTVTADDVRYAWTRILDPDFESQAAPMLYDIKNAVALKQEKDGISRDEIGIEANGDTLTITFEGKIDYDAFLRNLTSIALAPLREHKVASNEDNWSKATSTITTNGPFALRTINFTTGEFTLKRNDYYHVEEDGETASAKDIKPSQLIVGWMDELYEGDKAMFLSDKVNAFLDGTVFYLGSMPMNYYGDGNTKYLDLRKANQKEMEIVDLLSTYTYVFNTKKAIFADENVRRALSMAIDRNYLAEQLVYYKAADGFIANGVWEADSRKDTFRENAESFIATAPNMQEARKLLADKEFKGSIKLAVNNNPEELFIADYVAYVWSELGVNTIVEALDYDTSVLTKGVKGRKVMTASGEIYVYDDGVQVKYMHDDNFDVIGIDYNMYSTNAFTALCGFHSTMNGNGVERIFDEETGVLVDLAVKTHVSGFADAEYDKIIEKAFAEKDLEARAQYLHEAEAYLLSKMPVMPLLYNVNYYMTDSLSGVTVDGYGYTDFQDTKLR